MMSITFFVFALVIALIHAEAQDGFKPFIVGGKQAERGAYPFFVSLRYGTYHGCGASIFDEYHVLTAAHCVDGESFVEMTIGSYDLVDVANANGTVVIHPEYDSSTYENDIAIITLSERWEGPTISLAKPGMGQFENEMGTVIGIGDLKSGGEPPKFLHEVDVKITTIEDCEKAYAPRGYPVTADMICASSPGKGTCQNDSGGPFFVSNGDEFVQVGVVSWGIGCADPEYPGVYARVTHLYDWIMKQTVGTSC